MQDDQSNLILIDQLEDQIIDHPDASTAKQFHDSLDETFQKKLNAKAQQIQQQSQQSPYHESHHHSHHHHHHHNHNNHSKESDDVDGLSSESLLSDQGLSKDAGEDEVVVDGGDQDSRTTNNNNNNQVNYNFLITKSHLQYTYQEYDSLDQEISNWFSFNDLKTIGGLTNLVQLYEIASKDGESNISNWVDIINDCNSISEGTISTQLKLILYYSFGEYANKTNKQEQLQQIKSNNLKLLELKLFKPLIELTKEFISRIISLDTRTNNQVTRHKLVNNKTEADYFRMLTLLYFLVNVSLEYPKESSNFRHYLAESDFLTIIFTFIEHWKWHPNNSYRIRYLILLVDKLLLFELGGAKQLKECDDFLVKLHDIKNKQSDNDDNETDENVKPKLTCSPLDYFAFREDLLDKYPLYNDIQLKAFDFQEFSKALKEEDEQLDTNTNNNNQSIEDRYKYFMAINSFSNSLSNLMEIPKTTKSHTILSQLPTNPIHIATPVPSPTLVASDYMSGGEKIRRSYQVNQAMPFIYPTANGNTVTVPYATKEADEILKKSIYESYSIKRLWNERQKFMKQERGYINEYEQEEQGNQSKEDEFEYDYEKLKDKHPANQREIESMQRVETLYSGNVCRLHTIAEVLLETIKVNRLDYNLNFAELELNPETSFLNSNRSKNINNFEETKQKIEFVMSSQLEVIKIKEITLKATTSILVLLLKWFKISHILKSYYFSSILFDQQFFTIVIDYLSRAFYNPNLQSLISNENLDCNDDASNGIKNDLTEYEILINQNKLMNPQIHIPNYDFFNNCLQQFPKNYKFKLINKQLTFDLPEKPDINNINHIYITDFNQDFAFILSNLLTIINKILIKNQTQRIFTLNDLKISELYKMIIINYDAPQITKPILKTLKKLIPYQGRKWKSLNMDLISQIYLNLKLGIKDNWLSGKDLESDFNNSYDQEIALRGLLQFYNLRKYPKQMEDVGYRINKDLDIPILNLNVDEDGEYI
ncbi:FAR11 [[Candida] subhashii]|uniref:FAR11 n=1 Tax=[Candida] subhashii TaxID=561895 RepID=A0A8J5QBI9_9ASCO|nr:FAR11 [[Candida] subhashii]KAG7660597.1 FAR11 [[Candida] subhashii]